MKVFENAFSEEPVKIVPPVEDDKPEVDASVAPEETTEKTEEAAGSSPAKEPSEAEKPKEEGQARVATVPQAALHAEKERRKQAEARLAELEKTQTKPPTSVLEDEDKAFQERLAPYVNEIRRQRFEESVELAREKPGRDDYDDIYAFMNGEIEKDPSLMQQIIGSKRPGETIYTLGKTRKELAEVGGDLTKYREHVTAKEREELNKANERIKALEAEIARGKATAEKHSKIPSSLNTEQSGSPKDDTFSGPRPLKAVFNN